MIKNQSFAFVRAHAHTLLIYTLVVGVHFLPPLCLIRPYTLANFGLRWNWIWPIDALWMAPVAAKILGVRVLMRPDGSLKFIRQCLLGLLLGVLGYLGFRWGAGTASALAFKGFSLETFLFELLVPFAEEYFFRGVLQSYLAQFWRSHVKSEIKASLAAGLFISIPFGLSHALSPVFRGTGSFDVMALIETSMFSLLATALFARFGNISAPAAAHYAWNFIDHFF